MDNNQNNQNNQSFQNPVPPAEAFPGTNAPVMTQPGGPVPEGPVIQPGGPVMDTIPPIPGSPVMTGIGETPKKKKTGLIIGLVIAACAVIAAVLLIFVFDVFGLKGGKDQKSAEAVCEKFFSSIGEGNVDALFECFPEEVLKTMDIMDLGSSKEEMETALSMMKSFGVTFENFKVISTEDVDVDQLEDELEKEGADLDIKDAKQVVCSITMKANAFGQSSEETQEMTIICGKLGGKWYIVKANEDEQEESEDADDDEDSNPDDDEDTDWDEDSFDDTYEEPHFEAAALAEAPSGLPDTLDKMQFYIDGTVISVPSEKNQLPSDWKLRDGYVSDEDMTLEPESSSVTISYENEKYDPWFFMNLEFWNEGKSAIETTDGVVSSYTMDATNIDDPTKLPQVIFPKGVTWFVPFDTVKEVYGEPSYESTEDFYYLQYDLNDGTDSVYFSFNDDKLLTSINIRHFVY